MSQEGTSEEFIGEWMEKRDIRDQMVIATKVLGLPSMLWRGVLTPLVFAVHLQLGAHSPGRAEDALHRQQLQVAAPFHQGFSQETTN